MSQPRRLEDLPVAAVRDAVAKGVTVPSERLQEALDDAVRRGRMQRRDAEELALKLLGPVVRRIGGAGEDGLAIAEYETLTAAQVTQQLDVLDEAQLHAVRAHEVQHANRVSVLRAIDRRLA